MDKHPIVHIEFAAQDPKTAGEFYAKLFGWNVEHMEAMNYTMFGEEAGLGGGFPSVDGETFSPGDIVPYIQTEDIEASLAQAESLGGKIVQVKTEIPGMGWFGLFTDPTGNRVGVYTALAR
jgi:uncharacterized protein